MGRRILFLVPLLPYPPHQGGALRNYGLIRGLAGRGHRITLMTFRTPDLPEPEETPLGGLCERVVTFAAPERSHLDRLSDLLAGHADLARRFWLPAFQDMLVKLLEQEAFDVIHLGIEMAGYLPAIKHYAAGCPVVYDALNAEYDLQKRIALQDLKTLRRLPLAAYSLIQTRRLRKFEGGLCTSADYIFACSSPDADKLATLSHGTRITVIPNAIDVSQYEREQIVPARLVHPALVFTGKMDYRPNVDAALWFVEKVLPRVQATIPGVHFVVVGQRPHPRLDSLHGRPDITVTGFVPDIKPYITGADVYVAPLRMGSGTRFKLLESLMLGSAVVSTRIGAEGLSVEHGTHLLLADGADDFAAATIRLLKDEPLRHLLGENGRQFVRNYYDWSAIVPAAEAGYEAAIAQRTQ